MSSFFASALARAPSLARPPSFNDFGGSGLDAPEPRGSMESSASEFSPSSLGARASLDSRSGENFFERGGGAMGGRRRRRRARAIAPAFARPRLDGPSER